MIFNGKTMTALFGIAESGGFRWLGTLQNFDGTTKVASLDSSEGLGCVGEFSEFILFLTLPANTAQQLYIGHEMYSWSVYMQNAYSTTEQKKWRLHMRYAGEAGWITDGVYFTRTDLIDYAVPQTSGHGVTGNMRSTNCLRSTISTLHFLSQANFPEGTIIEVYGK